MAADPKKHENIFPISQETSTAEPTPAELKQKLAQVQADYALAVAHKAHLEELLDGIIHSTSWRITSPLRIVAALKRKFWPLLRFKKELFALVDSKDVVAFGEDGFKTKLGTPFIGFAKTDGSAFTAGWKKVSFKINQTVYFHLSFDEGHGYSDLHKRFILLTPDHPHAAINIPEGVKKIRIDFFETGEPVFLKLLSIRALGSLQLGINMVLSKLGTRPKYWLPKLKKAYQLFRLGGFHSIKIKLMGDEQTQSYQEWIDQNDAIRADDIKAMKEHLQTLPFQPKISVVVPTYNTPEDLLKLTIESVRSQVYENWELCIADDASTAPHVRRVLETYAKKDPRIKVLIREKNGHISASSNSALSLATGEYVALLDHDDELRPHALYMNVAELNAHPDAGLIYSDEDKTNIAGTRYNPYFKCDWNPELFLQQNYVCHLTVIKKSLIDAVGGFRLGFEGSQDWDLFLRVTEQLSYQQIRHIPHILYHWRAIEGSTAQSSDFKPYAMIAAEKALNEHFVRIGQKASVEPITAISQFRIRYATPTGADAPLVSIIIPTKDKLNILVRCVESILEKTVYPNYELIIIDNNSVEPETFAYFEAIKQHPRIRVIRDEGPFNFSALNNRAVAHANGSILGFLNNDLEIINDDWLCEMVSHVVRAQNGAVGARLWFPNQLLQHAGVILGIGGVAGHAHKGQPRSNFGYFNRSILTQNFSAVTAACLLIRKEVFEAVGGFDEKDLTVAFNDVDLCLKVDAAGFLNVWTPYAEAFHYESLSRGYEHSPKKFERFEKESRTMKTRWGKTLIADRFYSPNLTVQSEDFRMANPSRAEKPWASTVHQ